MLPAIFFGHGNPMNALLKNEYTDAWKRIGQAIARPTAKSCRSRRIGLSPGRA